MKASLLRLFLQEWAPTYLPSLILLLSNYPNKVIVPAHTHAYLPRSPRSIWPDCRPPLCMSKALHNAISAKKLPDFFIHGHRHPSGLIRFLPWCWALLIFMIIGVQLSPLHLDRRLQDREPILSTSASTSLSTPSPAPAPAHQTIHPHT